MLASGLYNHSLFSMQEAVENMFVPKMTQYVRKWRGHLSVFQTLK